MGSRPISTICRLCLRESHCFTNIFEVNASRSYVLANVIADLLQYPVLPNDGYPQNVCSGCADKLTEFTLFKEQCRESKAAYDNYFAMRSCCGVQHETPEPLVTYIKTEPVELADDEESETQADADPEQEVKQEETEVQSEEEKSLPRWGCDESSVIVHDQERQRVKEDEEEEEEAEENDKEGQSGSYISGHSFETRIIHVQSLPQGNYANINYRYPMEIWQPISETADERRRRLARERSRRMRAKLTPEQLVLRRTLNTQRTALRRQNETPEERERRRRLDAYRTAMRRLNETPEQKEERRRLDKVRHAWRRRSIPTLALYYDRPSPP